MSIVIQTIGRERERNCEVLKGRRRRRRSGPRLKFEMRDTNSDKWRERERDGKAVTFCREKVR